jgi:tetratricopeptide (TPR) repeat protein
MDSLATDGALGAELRARIVAASAGNPLYVEEMLAMVREQGGDGEISVPPTIHALLQARIDSLDTDVRVVMERGSVEGEVFHRGAVAVLSPDPVRDDVESHLTTLVRKELIRSTSPTFPDEEGFRFRHLLIRDAAYESLPKATRAELHERFAEWLARQELVERDEIVGYHLEQAHRYRLELDPTDAQLLVLADGVAARLGAAGLGALERGDVAASLALFHRAIAVLPEGDDRGHQLAPHLALAYWDVGDLAAATAALSDAAEASDPVLAAVSTVLLTVFSALEKGGYGSDERDARRRTAYSVLSEAGDDEGLAFYWWTVATEHWFQLHATETISACERGLEHLRRSGTRGRFEVEFMWLIRSGSVLGPMPVDEALARLDRREVGARESMMLDASTDGARARLLACQGRFEPARELVRSARETMKSAGAVVPAAGMTMFDAWVEQRAGDLQAWERALRVGLEELASSDETAFRATTMVYLAECLYQRGRYDEAFELCRTVRDISPPDDVVNFVLADAVGGAVLVQRGDAEEGFRLLDSALGRADATDFYFCRAEVRLMLVDGHALAGQVARAGSYAAEALELYVAKGDVAGAERARERFARLGIDVV